MSAKTKKILVSVIVLLCAGITAFFVYYNDKISIDSQVNELYALSKTVSIEQMEKKGFINVTETLDRENPEITGFFSNRKPPLKTFAVRDGELYAQLLIYDSDPNVRAIRSWTYLPWKQVAVSPDKWFSGHKLIIENEVTSVKLINVQNASMPVAQTLQDEILYSYRTDS